MVVLEDNLSSLLNFLREPARPLHQVVRQGGGRQLEAIVEVRGRCLARHQLVGEDQLLLLLVLLLRHREEVVVGGAGVVLRQSEKTQLLEEEQKGQILNVFEVRGNIQGQLVPCHQRKVGGKKHKTVRVDQQVFTNLDKDMIDVKCI